MRYNPNFELETLIVVRYDEDDYEQRILETKPAIYLAVEKGHEKIVELLLAREPWHVRDCLVVFRNDEGNKEKQMYRAKSAVYLAVEQGHDKIVALLLANPDAILGEDKKMHRTPLHIAAANGRDSIVAPLLAREPSAADERDRNGETALHHAVRAGIPIVPAAAHTTLSCREQFYEQVFTSH